jgi:hypothetical protein
LHSGEPATHQQKLLKSFYSQLRKRKKSRDLWTPCNTMPPKLAPLTLNSLFTVNKLQAFAHYDSVRTDSNANERGISDMAKAMKKKAVAKKKKPAMKRTASKKRATKRRR